MTRDVRDFKVGCIEWPPSTADEDSHAVLAMLCHPLVPGTTLRLYGDVWEFREDPSWRDFHLRSEGRPVNTRQA